MGAFAMSLMLGLAVATPAAMAADTVISVGSPAMLFSLPAINEDAAMELVQRPRVSLTDFTGVSPLHESKAVVVHFFDQTRGGDDLATLNRLQRRYGGKGVQVVAISGDRGSMGSLSTWVEELKLSFPVVRDNHGVVQSRYQVNKLPMTVVIDGDGYIFAIGRPEGLEMEAALEAELAPLLQRD